MTYRPIDCSVHDQLEHVAVLRRVCRIRYRTPQDQEMEVLSRIVDIFARGGEEFVRLESGDEVRLDRLIAVAEAPD